MIEDPSIARIGGRAHVWGGANNYSIEDIEWIARRFRLPEPIQVDHFPGKGNINLHTYEVSAAGESYLLQKVNSEVFTLPHRVMNGLLSSVEAQEQSLAAGKGDPSWVPIKLIPTIEGGPYLDLSDDTGLSVWRLMVRIPECVSYKNLSEVPERREQLRLAEEIGRGLAIYSDLTSSIDARGIEGSLPGYRDTGLYYRQFHSVLSGNRTLEDAHPYLPEDPITRAGTEQHFLLGLDEASYQQRLNDPDLTPYIDLVRRLEPFAMGLWDAVQDGRVRHTLIHGDTKIENFLFCAKTGRAKALVDLDTIMPFTWLADWGDLQRSMVNVAGEKERDLTKVLVDREVYAAVARGFLNEAKQITQGEIDLMVSAVQAITLELGLRFLTDYLKGDTYFQLAEGDPKDLNKVRAMVQLTLFQRLEDFAPEAERLVRELTSGR